MALDQDDTMAVLASILSDPAAASAKLKELNAARDAAKFAKLDNEKKVKEAQKIEEEANATFKKASEERLAAARALKDAEEARKKMQAVLDTIGIREGEVSAREGALDQREADLKKQQDALALKERQLAERDASNEAQAAELAKKLADLNRKLKALKDIAA